MHSKQFALGASMYVPATQDPADLIAIGNGEKFSNLRSIIYCTEDAVRADQVRYAIRNLGHTLPQLNKSERPLRFIRVRSPHVLGQVLGHKGIENIDGFVLPKVTASNMTNYLDHLGNKSPFMLMPTLETEETYDFREMNRLRRLLQKDPRCKGRILCLRVGGNDLLRALRVRRDPRRTIYDTPVGDLISRLAGEFIANGFGLTAPVFESIENPDVLAEEVKLDLLHGLFGKTAIHPSQIAVIEDGFKVSAADLAEAQKILECDAPAVFRMGGRMCEPTTHTPWAKDIITRCEIYGVKDDLDDRRRSA